MTYQPPLFTFTLPCNELPTQPSPSQLQPTSHTAFCNRLPTATARQLYYYLDIDSPSLTPSYTTSALQRYQALSRTCAKSQLTEQSILRQSQDFSLRLATDTSTPATFNKLRTAPILISTFQVCLHLTTTSTLQQYQAFNHTCEILNSPNQVSSDSHKTFPLVLPRTSSTLQRYQEFNRTCAAFQLTSIFRQSQDFHVRERIFHTATLNKGRTTSIFP